MRAERVVIGAVAVLLVAGFAAAKLTVGPRSSAARERLEAAAARFAACYERDRSYLRCRPGTSKLGVSDRSRTSFALTSSVELGPTYTISRTRDRRPERVCQPPGEACPNGTWRALEP